MADDGTTDIAVGAGLTYLAYATPYGWAALAAYQVFSGLQTANKIKKQARMQNKINAMNAKYLENDAYEAEKFGGTQAARYQSVIDKNQGEQKVAYAAQNVDLNYGTASDMQAENRVTGLLNIVDIQSQARQKAAGLRREAANVRAGMANTTRQAALDAHAARVQGIASAAQTGLAGYDRNHKTDNNELGKTSKTSGYAGSYGETPSRITDSWPGRETSYA